MKSCTFLILTYKGKHHLKFLLPTVRDVIEATKGYQLKVLIVDNGRDKPTRNFVETQFPEFEFEYSPANDYLFALNPYMQRIESDYVFLLNDDIKLHAEVLNEALPLLDNDSRLFAVHCHVRDWDNTYSAEGIRKMNYQRGWMQNFWFKENEKEAVRHTLYAGGGTSVFRTQMFNELRGFDTLFRPAYCEDLDLGHRAWQQGWKVVQHPRAILYHREGGTIADQFKANQLEQKVIKNQILWMVKNVNYPGFLFWFLLLLPYRLLLGWRVHKNSFAALYKALPRIPKALRRRSKRKHIKLKDKQLISLLNTEHQSEKNS